MSNDAPATPATPSVACESVLAELLAGRRPRTGLAYCERLGFPFPDVVALAADPRVSIRQLVMAVVLCGAGPVGWKFVDRVIWLTPARRVLGLRASVLRACVDGGALFRWNDGSIDVDLGSREWGELGRAVFGPTAIVRTPRPDGLQCEPRRRPRHRRRLTEPTGEESSRDEVDAPCARRALVHALHFSGRVLAAVVFDPIERSLTTLFGDDVPARLPDILAKYDVLVGLQIRELLRVLGLFNAHPCATRPWRLVDLASTPKTRRVYGRPRKLFVSDFIEQSLGVRYPLEEPIVLARAFYAGERDAVAGRLEAEALTLHAYYRYGILHKGVHVHIDGYEGFAWVDWSEPGDATIYSLVAQVEKDGRPIEVTLRPLTSFSQRWARSAWLGADSAGLWLERGPSGWSVPDRCTYLDVLDARRT